jgi:hypothetical protein
VRGSTSTRTGFPFTVNETAGIDALPASNRLSLIVAAGGTPSEIPGDPVRAIAL